jgi:hypothetical protein
MNQRLSASLLASLALGATALSGDNDKKTVAPLTPLDDRWRFSLSVPGWLAGLEGDIGIGGAVSRVDVSPRNIIRRIDMATLLRGEASKGRFGITGDFVYLSLSDGVGTSGVVKKLDLQVDEIIGELGMRWRVIEGKRGYLDVIGGVRYVNLYQKLVLQPNSERIGEASTNLVDEVGERLRTALSESGLRDVIAQQLGAQLAALDGRNPTLPIGPLGAHERTPILDRIRQIIDSRKTELAAALRDRAQAATDALRAQAQARVDSIKRDVSRKIARTLESKLDTTVSRTDDWFDPYIGLRARFNFTDRLYATAKGDIGGFGLDSDFTWQAEAALGCQLTARVFAEAGYRALGIDYEDDGLTYDTITHGAEVTVGINF